MAKIIFIADAQSRSRRERVELVIGPIVCFAVFVCTLFPQLQFPLLAPILGGLFFALTATVSFRARQFDRRVLSVQAKALMRLNRLSRPISPIFVDRVCRLIAVSRGWPRQTGISAEDILRLESELGVRLPRVWVFRSARWPSGKTKEIAGRIFGVPFGPEGRFLSLWFWTCFWIMPASMVAAVIAARVMHVSPLPSQLVGACSFIAMIIPGIVGRRIRWRVGLTANSIRVERVNKQDAVIESQEIPVASTFVFIYRKKLGGMIEAHGPVWVFRPPAPGVSFAAMPPDVSRNPWGDELEEMIAAKHADIPGDPKAA